MQIQRGFVGVGVLIAILVGLVVLGGGTYYVVQQQLPPHTALDTENLNTLSIKGNQVQQPVNNKLVETATLVDSSSVQLKTYTNAKWGYDIKYPTDWSVGKEESILDKTNKIFSTVNIQAADKKHSVLIEVHDVGTGDLLRFEAPSQDKITVNGKPYTAYIFPEGYECRMADPEAKDCSYFMIPIPRETVTVILYAFGDARSVTDVYKDIFSTFALLQFDASLPAKTIEALPPDFVFETARFKQSADPQKVVVEFIVDNLSAHEFSGDIPIEVREEGRQEVLAVSSTPGRRVMVDPYNTKWFSVSFEKFKIVGSNKEHPALDIHVNPQGAFNEVNISNNTVHIPSY
jgi:hypothetical protein